MSQAAVGAEGSFTAVYEATYGSIHAYAKRRVGADSADEVAAETYLVAWKRIGDLPIEPLPWLYGIARNVVARHGTVRGRQMETEAALRRERPRQESFPGESRDPELWRAWARLGPADREVLALVAWEELAVADAARALGCSPPVLSVRLHRARRRLQRLLTDTGTRPVPLTELSEV
jgi:RNA polymerase sigma-70 factor (ECF subfamily)